MSSDGRTLERLEGWLNEAPCGYTPCTAGVLGGRARAERGEVAVIRAISPGGYVVLVCDPVTGVEFGLGYDVEPTRLRLFINLGDAIRVLVNDLAVTRIRFELLASSS